MEAARRYLRKDARVNIRISTADLDMLKRRAAEEGLPYQTLIASVLHKYVSRVPPPFHEKGDQLHRTVQQTRKRRAADRARANKSRPRARVA